MTCYLVVNNKLNSQQMTVRYTPGQLRDAAAVPPETYRHWKKALAPLRRDTRQSPCFTAGDLLAVAVVRSMTRSFIRVGALSVIAEELFRLCSDTSWPVLERSRMIVDLVNQRVELQPESEDVDLDSPALVCPLRPLVGQLRDALLTDGEPDQQRLNLPPVPLPSTTAGHRQAVARGRR